MSFSFTGDLKNTAFLGASVLPQTIASNTTVNGVAVDCQTSDDILSALYITGDSGDASTTITVFLTESDTSTGSYTAISGATVTLTGSATANDNLCAAVSTRLRSKRWVKANVTTASGSSISVPIAVALVGRKKITGSGAGYTLAPTT